MHNRTKTLVLSLFNGVLKQVEEKRIFLLEREAAIRAEGDADYVVDFIREEQTELNNLKLDILRLMSKIQAGEC